MKNKKINIVLVILLTIIVLYFSLKDQYQQIIPLLFDANIIWLVVSYLLVLSYTFLKSVVTNEIINSFKEFEIIKTFKLQLMTFFFNAVTPFSTGGQPFQIYILNKNKISLAESTNIIVQESIIHQTAVSLVLIITIILNSILNIYDLNFTMKIIVLISMLINTLVVGLLFVISFGRKINNNIGKYIINLLYKLKIVKNKAEVTKKIEKSLNEFNDASTKLLQNKKRFIKLISINSLALICLYISPLTILFSLNNYYAFNAIDAIVLVSFVSIISCYIPLPGGSLGQEYLFTQFFGLYLTNPILGSLMLLWRFITYYLPMIIGAIIFNTSKKN